MTKTTNYGLNKPAYADAADIKVLNDNMDIIDEKMKEIADASGGGGSNVAWNQIQTGGAKIAEITIDGNKQDVYAPTSGGGGEGRLVELLLDNTESQIMDGEIVLANSIMDYDEIVIVTMNNFNGDLHDSFENSYIKEDFSARIGRQDENYCLTPMCFGGGWMSVKIPTDNTLCLGDSQSLCIAYIYGIKYNAGGGMTDYSGLTGKPSINGTELAGNKTSADLGIASQEEVGKLKEDLVSLTFSINHRNIYRGKNLGTSVTSAQKAAIQYGTFDDLFIGDYWVINGVTWVIADMDYFYNCGDTAFTKHHLVIVPNSILYNAKMNSSNVTTGGYVGSQMYTENLKTAKTIITAAFGDMVLTHREYLVNAVTNGQPSAGGWFDSKVELMNEIMVYGCHVHVPANNGVKILTRFTVAKQQLALFALNPKAINKRTDIWLRDVVSEAYFAAVGNNGLADSNYASFSFGVLPEFCIG